MKSATALEIILWIKVIATIFFWVLPLLLMPGSGFKKIGIPPPEPLLFGRLLGAAFLALLVGYLLGLKDLYDHKDITNVVWMGIVSNGMACIVLAYFGLTGTWKVWSKPGSTLMWLSAIFTGAICLGLILTGLIFNGTPIK